MANGIKWNIGFCSLCTNENHNVIITLWYYFAFTFKEWVSRKMVMRTYYWAFCFPCPLTNENETYFLNIIQWMKFIQWTFRRRIIRHKTLSYCNKVQLMKRMLLHMAFYLTWEPKARKMLHFPSLGIVYGNFYQWNQQLALQFSFACFYYRCCNKRKCRICWKFSTGFFYIHCWIRNGWLSLLSIFPPMEKK